MNPDEILNRFLIHDEDECREYVKQPFHKCSGVFSFATNGSMLVRVHGLYGSILPSQPDPDILPWKWLAECNNPVLPTVRLRALLEEAKAQHTCPKCTTAPRAATSESCRECYGDGFVEFDSGYNTYEVECRTCRGDGAIKYPRQLPYRREACPKCHGEGLEFWGLRIERLLIYIGYLNRVIYLPGVCLYENTEYHNDGIFGFRFNGGDGFVMPMRAK